MAQARQNVTIRRGTRACWGDVLERSAQGQRTKSLPR